MAAVRIGTYIAYKFAFMLMECQIAQTTIIEVRAIIFHLSFLWVRSQGNLVGICNSCKMMCNGVYFCTIY